jgi:RimJ/RimL family protein N-acetyltransferase
LYYKSQQQTFYCSVPLDFINNHQQNQVNSKVSDTHIPIDHTNTNKDHESNSCHLRCLRCNNYHLRCLRCEECIIYPGTSTSDWFPIINTNKIQLRQISSADICDFMNFRYKISESELMSSVHDANLHVEDKLRSTDIILKNYNKDRKTLQAIRWGITLLTKSERENAAMNYEENRSGSESKSGLLVRLEDQFASEEKEKEEEDQFGIIIGSIGLRFDKINYRAELEYALHPQYWNRGIMKVAIATAITYLIVVMKLPLRTIDAHVDSSNNRSCALLKSLGFKCKGQLIQNYYHVQTGIFQDTNIFQLVLI